MGVSNPIAVRSLAAAIASGLPVPGRHLRPVPARQKGFVSIFGPTFPTGGERFIDGSFVVDATAPAGGNGILVGQTGTGTTLNGVAGTGPLNSLAALTQAIEAGQYARGDLFFFRQSAPHFVGQYRYFNNLGTTKGWNQSTFDADPYAKDPNVLEFRSYPGEEAVIDTLGASPIVESGSGYGCWIMKGNFRVSLFEIRCGNSMFFAGGGGGLTGPSAGGHIYRCRQINTYTTAQRPFGNQSGPIKMQGGNATDFTVQQSVFRGSQQSSDNNCTLYCETLGPGNLFLDNFFDYPNVSLGHTLHFKYPAAPLALDQWLFQGGLVTSNNLRDMVKGADGNSGVTFRHMVFWMRSPPPSSPGNHRYDNTEGDTGTQNQPPGIQAFQKRMYNCGYYNAGGLYNFMGLYALQWTLGSQEGTEWEFYDNELMGRFYLSAQSGGVGSGYTELLSADGNVYGDSVNALTHNRGRYTPTWPGTDYTLAQWKLYQQYMGAGKDDANSVNGPIVFLNPGTQDPENLATFVRDPTSPRYNLAGPDISQRRRWAGAGVGTWV